MSTTPWSRARAHLSGAWARRHHRGVKHVAVTAVVALSMGAAAYVFDLPLPWDGPNPPAVQDWGAPAEGRDGKVVPRERDRGWKGKKPKPAVWPKADHEQVPLAGSSVKVGGMPVSAREGTGGEAAQVGVRTFTRKAARDAGVAGVMLEVSDPTIPEGEQTDGRQVRLTLDYGRFATGYGGSYGARLGLYRAEGCDTGTPSDGCAAAMTPVDTVNNSEKQTLSATVDTPNDGAVYVIAAAGDSSQGSYGATGLSPSSSWSAGGSSGGFNWSYPIETLPTPGDLAPSIGLTYSSQSTDGKTAATNNQGSWVGEGFTYEPGYVERRYKPCSDDGHDTSGDLCWAWDNATIMLEGRSGELVKDGGKWRLSSDDGSRVERLTDTTNDDDNDEYWKVTTTDGTQYFFGKHRLPGWASGDEVTNSVWTAPVFGDDLNEPCNDATFASSHCDQAWRWNLDHVIDTHGNAVSYFYAKETNHYALNGKTDVNGTAYTRGGYLKQIDYGQRANAVYSTPAPARVLFDTSERCLPSGQITCAPGELNESTAQYWPDVPWDRNCEASTHCELSQLTPTFWTRKRLTEITTEARVAGAYSKVSSWKLEHTFISNADTTRSLWLHKVTRSGHLGGSTVTLPSTELLGDQFANRVDKIGDSISPLIRPRLATVYTDTGGQLDVNYSPEDCTPADTPAPASNTRRCYPVKWQPGSQQNPITDWFHKYVVTGVTASDRVGGSPDQVTMYDYVGGAAWRHTKPDGITKTDDLTWGDWRGYEKVRVFSAPGTTLETRVDQTYFRGMHGDDNGSSGTRDVTVTDSTSVAHTDYDELAGELLESMVYNDTDVVSKTITSRWRHITATDAHSWGDQKSAFVRPKTARGFVALEAGGWRETKTVTTYDTSYGRPVEVDDLADVSTPDDDQCTRTEFTDNTGMNIVSLPARSETVSVACAATPNRDTQVVADDRITYHGEAFGTEPLEPGKTSMITQELESHDGVTATYVTVADVEYDTYGRATKVTDAEGKATSTVYTDTDGLTTRQEVTNALGHASATVLNPAIGEPASATDANGMLTELSYDALGRLSAVWLANRSKATGKSPNVKFDYTVTDGAPVSVKTETLTNDETYRASYEVFDGWLRSRQAQTPAAPDARLVTDTSYDAVGRVKTVNDAYAATGAPSGALLVVADGAVNGQSTNVYDNAGRIVAGVFAVAGVEKWRSTASYGGDRVHSTPPAGGTPTTAIVDALGRTVELRQYHGGSPSGEYDATTYTHTRRGELKTVTDEAGNTWSYAYDDRGRKTSSTDPDAGTTTFDYDDLGLLISTTDARGKTISHTYDDLDRKTATYRGDPNTGTKVAEWYWDLYDKGQLAGTRSYDGELELTHVINDRDTLYRPIRETYTLGGTGAGALTGSYQFNPSYNIDGTLKGTTFPAAGGMAGEGVLNTYDTLGRAKDIDGDLAYADNIQYSPTGLLAQVGLFAGAKQSWRTFEYEKGSNRLDRAFLSTAQVTGTTADTRYGYDPAGNATSIIDDPTAAGGQRDAQCFDYDHLRRLTTAWTTATGGDGAAACAGGPETTGVAGPGGYWHDYGFDTTGNRTTMTAHATGIPGDPTEDITRTYTYPTPGGDDPHQLQQVTETTPSGSVTHGYDYDEGGSTTTRPNETGDTQTLTWDDEGNLATVTDPAGKTEFFYDVDGSRYLRRDTDGSKTLFLPGMELRQPAGSSSVEATRYYALPGGVTYVRTATSGQYQLADHHGTGTLSLDPDTGATEQRRFDPYGNERGPQPAEAAWAGDLGFVGGVEDPTGLTHLGAREYDPTTGRFISVDPLIDVGDPQQMNGYSYANNTPATLSDPDGLRPEGGFDEDTGKQIIATPNPNGGWYIPGSKGSSSPEREVERAQDKLRAAKARMAALKRKLINAGKLLLDILLEVTGAKAGIDCFLKGDVAACVDTAITVVSGLVGGLLAKIGLRYAFRWKAAARLAGKVRKLVGNIMDVAKNWGKTSTALGKAKRGLAAAKSRLKAATGRGKGCLNDGNSFTPATKVAMADGTTKQIRDVEVGDKVLAADPDSGKTEPRQVTALIKGVGLKHLVKITIDTDHDGHGDGKITATDGHPFWVAKPGRWVDAKNLEPGHMLRTSTGTWITITAVREFARHRTVHNLTVNDLHTYHVAAGAAPVLVHNCGDAAKHSADNLADSLGDDVFFHYTDEAGHATITEGGVVKANSKGVSYFTREMVTSGDANNVLFAGNPQYAGRGSHVIGFRISPDRLGPGVQPNELVHQGSFRFTLDDVVYHGANPFD